MLSKKMAAAGALATAGAFCAFGQISSAARPRISSGQASAKDQRFMKTLAQGSMAEVRLGKLALLKTRNTQVHNVATTIVQDHSQANSALMQVAKHEGVKLPSDTDPQHKAMYAKLSHMSGTAFDKAYIAGQVKDHDKTVKMIGYEKAATHNKRLLAFLGETLPKIKMHRTELHQINGRMMAGHTGPVQGGLKLSAGK